jgi:RNA polymerase sigma factor (sigma-70 family)
MDVPLHTTRVSLLQQLNDQSASSAAWEEFVRLYGRHVLRWCRGFGLQESDAEDVAQDVLVRFWKQAAAFRYDPRRRFRSYLRKIVTSALADWSAKRKEKSMPGGGDASTPLDTLPARDDLVRRIEDAYDTELLALAMDEVRERVKPRTWEAFKLLAIEQQSGAEVADRLGIDVSLAYVARRNVQRMLYETVARLEGQQPPDHR